MSQDIIGRKKQLQQLQQLQQSDKSEFVAVYGRRRVGKTYLIRQHFYGHISFHLTGLANVGKTSQLLNFHNELLRYFPQYEGTTPVDNWLNAFQLLIKGLESIAGKGKKIIFLDELPWLDTRGSDFLPALEHFWNSWASARRDILLIVCGSAASWMIQNLLNNKGGLHNRITDTIKLAPFTLAETEAFLSYKNVNYNRYQIVLLYMVLGGIPFYLEKIENGLSAAQNIDKLCFSRNAPFRTEYENLFASLFNKAERHMSIVEALSQKNKGLDRTAIIKATKLSDGGGLSRLLLELEESNFIRKYRAYGKRERDSLYQLTDLYTLFYHNFIKKSQPDDENYWINALESPSYRAWGGYAFEMLCLHHIPEIKEALGIRAVQTSVSSWQSNDAQIDLIIDRKDQVINLCEMKFSIHPYSIDKKYAANLQNKMGSFREATKTKKALFLTMITTYGIARNKYSGMVQNDLSMELFFNG